MRNMKMRITYFLTALMLAGYSLNSVAADPVPPTDAEQVAGLQKMCTDSAAAIKLRQTEKPLYERLGKRAKINKFVGKLFDAHASNAKVGHMFKHVKKGPFVKNVTDFLVVGTGGKATYKGREMGEAHRHLKITAADFVSAGGDVQSVMKGMKYGENEIQEVVCALVSFVPVVVVQ